MTSFHCLVITVITNVTNVRAFSCYTVEKEKTRRERERERWPEVLPITEKN